MAVPASTSDSSSSSLSGPLGEVKQLPVAELSPMAGNPRRGQVDVIAESLRVNGQYRPIVVNVGSLTGRPMEILAGNHTWIAARSLGWESITAFVVDVDEGHAKRIVAVDNRATDLATYDAAELLALLESLDDLAGTGFAESDVTALSTAVGGGSPDAPDDFPTFDEDLATEFCCPKCGYEWSGRPS